MIHITRFFFLHSEEKIKQRVWWSCFFFYSFKHTHHHTSGRPAIVARWLLLPFIVLLLFFSVGNCLPLIGNPQTCQNSDRPVVIICYLLLLEKIACHLFWQIWLWKIKWNEMTSCLRFVCNISRLWNFQTPRIPKILSISRRTDTLIQTLADFKISQT